MRPFIRSGVCGLCLVLVLLALGSCGDDDTPTKPKPTPTYTLYYSQDGNGNGLYTIDTETGAGTIVGDGVSGVTSSTVGLAYCAEGDGILYGSRWASLLEINLDGSGATDMGGVGNEALAYDNDAGILYGCLNGAFRTINPADGTVVTALTGPGQDVEGLAVDPATGNVYGLGTGNPATLMLYDATAGTWSTIGETGLGMFAVGLAYQPHTKTLYAVSSSTSSIYTLDTTTGAATLVGAHGIAGSGGGGLTFVKD